MSMIVKMIMVMRGCKAIGTGFSLVLLLSEELVDESLHTSIFVVPKSLSLSVVVIVFIAFTLFLRICSKTCQRLKLLAWSMSG